MSRSVFPNGLMIITYKSSLGDLDPGEDFRFASHHQVITTLRSDYALGEFRETARSHPYPLLPAHPERLCRGASSSRRPSDAPRPLHPPERLGLGGWLRWHSTWGRHRFSTQTTACPFGRRRAGLDCAAAPCKARVWGRGSRPSPLGDSSSSCSPPGFLSRPDPTPHDCQEDAEKFHAKILLATGQVFRIFLCFGCIKRDI